jgi:hypothetical protein
VTEWTQTAVTKWHAWLGLFLSVLEENLHAEGPLASFILTWK